MGEANGDIWVFFYNKDKILIDRVRGKQLKGKITARAPTGSVYFSFTGDVKLHKLNVSEAEYEPFRMEIYKDG